MNGNKDLTHTTLEPIFTAGDTLPAGQQPHPSLLQAVASSCAPAAAPSLRSPASLPYPHGAFARIPQPAHHTIYPFRTPTSRASRPDIPYSLYSLYNSAYPTHTSLPNGLDHLRRPHHRGYHKTFKSTCPSCEACFRRSRHFRCLFLTRFDNRKGLPIFRSWSHSISTDEENDNFAPCGLANLRFLLNANPSCRSAMDVTASWPSSRAMPLAPLFFAFRRCSASVNRLSDSHKNLTTCVSSVAR